MSEDRLNRPIEDRRYGRSKLGFKQQLLYLEHLRRLYLVKYGTWNPTLQFLFVGGMGTLVNLAALTLLLQLRLAPEAAVAIAILTALCFNFVLNRRLAFPGARDRAWPRRFSSFRLVDWCGDELRHHARDGIAARACGRSLPRSAASRLAPSSISSRAAISRSGLRACDREPTAVVSHSVRDPCPR